MNVQTLAVTINLRYDSLLLDGEYDLSGKLVKVIPLSARGPFTVTASNSKVGTQLSNISITDHKYTNLYPMCTYVKFHYKVNYLKPPE